METTKPISKSTRIVSPIIRVISILFLLMDAIMKVFKAAPSMEGCAQLGWPQEYVQSAGMILLVFTIIYIVPRTAFAGALLLTAFLGGATSIMIRANISGHPFYFPILVAVLVWIPVFLREEKLRELLLKK